MWVQDSDRSPTDIMNEARAMRDATMARYIAMAWHSLMNAFSHLVSHAKPGHPHAS